MPALDSSSLLSTWTFQLSYPDQPNLFQLNPPQLSYIQLFHPTQLPSTQATQIQPRPMQPNFTPLSPKQHILAYSTNFHSRNIGSTHGHSAKSGSIQSKKTKFCSANPPQHDITQLYSTQTKLNTLNPTQHNSAQLNPSLSSSVLVLLFLLLPNTKYLLPNPTPLPDSLSFSK